MIGFDFNSTGSGVHSPSFSSHEEVTAMAVGREPSPLQKLNIGKHFEFSSDKPLIERKCGFQQLHQLGI